MSGIINLVVGYNYRRRENNSMGVLDRERKLLRKMIDHSYRLGKKYGELKKIKDKRRLSLIKKVVLSSDQDKAIDIYYKKNFGKKISHDWHRLYTSYTGKFTKRYLPEILFSSIYEPKVNPEDYRYVLDDKLLLSLFCTDINNVRIPSVFGVYCNGIYRDEKYITMTRSDFIDRFGNAGKVIIKPAQDTSSGQKVYLVNIKDKMDLISGISLVDILNSFRGSFMIQELIIPHETLRTLYPNSANTFRIVTYLWNNKVNHCPVTLRIGQGGSYLDNAHAGGMFIEISDEGLLADKAYTEFQSVHDRHPDTNVKFKNYRIPYVKDLIESAKKMHLNAPQLGVISWDLTIDEDGFFVLLEANTRDQSIWFPQMASGRAAFGDNTDEILQFISNRKLKRSK